MPHRSYKFEECNSRDTVSTTDGIRDKEKSNPFRQERMVNGATKNSMRIEKKMQELQQLKRQSSKN